VWHQRLDLTAANADIEKVQLGALHDAGAADDVIH
jgi:hypothetical protein